MTIKINLIKQSIKNFLPHTCDSSTLSFITMMIGLVIIVLAAILTILKRKNKKINDNKYIL